MARTFLSLVQRAVMSLGETPPSTLVNPSQTTQVAMGAVNDAVADIYCRARWDWRLKQFFLTLTAGQASYDLPADFGELHTMFMPLRNAAEHLTYIPYQDLMAQYPDFLLRLESPTEWSNDSGLSLSMVAPLLAYGIEAESTPRHFTVFGPGLVVWPPPNAAFAGTGQQLLFTYYCLAPELTVDGSLLQIPANLWPAVTMMSQALLKQYREFPDAVADERRAERMINTQMDRRTRRTPGPMRFRVRSS